MILKNNKKVNKKAAVFGIDARITMLIIAIFGLFSSTVFYAVVSKSKCEAIISTMKNIDLAIEEYIDDTKSIPASINQLYDTLPAKASQSNRWNGPYLNGDKTDPFVPTIAWSQESNNCNSGSTSSKYCSYILKMEFHNISNGVFNKIKEYYTKIPSVSFQSIATPVITYTSATQSMAIIYGVSENGSYNRVKYKVTESP